MAQTRIALYSELVSALVGKSDTSHTHAFSVLTGSATNAQTTATEVNTASAIVARDANGDFAARDITLRNLAPSGTITLGTAGVIVGDATNGWKLQTSGGASRFQVNIGGTSLSMYDGTRNWTINNAAAASGELQAGVRMYDNRTGGNVSLMPDGGSTTAGRVQICYFKGTDQFREALGIANTASGFGVLDVMKAGGTVRIGSSGAADLVVAGGGAAIATSATVGFLYVTSCAGTPTGVPTPPTGTIPLVVDTTNSKLYALIGGTWKGIVLI